MSQPNPIPGKQLEPHPDYGPCDGFMPGRGCSECARIDEARGATLDFPSGVDLDLVNHPPHYTTGKIEVLDFILDQKFGYLDGQVVKYVSRFRHKGSALQDLKKAQFYLSRLIHAVEAES